MGLSEVSTCSWDWGGRGGQGGRGSSCAGQAQENLIFKDASRDWKYAGYTSDSSTLTMSGVAAMMELPPRVPSWGAYFRGQFPMPWGVDHVSGGGAGGRSLRYISHSMLVTSLAK